VIHQNQAGALMKHGRRLQEICRLYPSDFNSLSTTTPLPQPQRQYYRPDGSFYREQTDEWGCLWAYHQDGVGGQVIRHPLEDWGKLRQLMLPPPQLALAEARRQMVLFWQEMKDYPVWGSGSIFFERMHYLHGYENLLCDIAEDCPQVYELADRILYEYILPGLENLFGAGLPIDLVGFGDDWGTQDALMIRPETWRKIFKPRYQKMFDLCHRHGALVYMHSDGMILDIVPDLIEIGVNCLNPQFSCLDLSKLRQLADKRLCISTDIDRQHVLPFGTPAQVRDYVKMVHEVLGGPAGGLIWRGEIGPDVPLENAEAMYEAFYEFGSY
jgi:hypothetical protein